MKISCKEFELELKLKVNQELSVLKLSDSVKLKIALFQEIETQEISIQANLLFITNVEKSVVWEIFSENSTSILSNFQFKFSSKILQEIILGSAKSRDNFEDDFKLLQAKSWIIQEL